MAKILIIDDEPDLCDEFSKILQDDNHIVESAQDGVSALKQIQEKTYDVIFLDVLMPRMEGREVLEEIRKSTQTPVAIISGYLTPDKEREALKLGAVGCFKKPFKMQEIKKLIDKVTKKVGSDG